MRTVAAGLVVCLSASLWAVDARKSPAEYAAQGKGKDIEVGADYMVRSFMAEGQSFSIDDYLLVELGVYPVGGETPVHLERFRLRINGKNLLLPQTPGMVAASLKYPNWTSKPSLEVAAGPVILGRRQPVGRFPGDPREQPAPRRDPIAPESKTNPIDYTDVISRAALPERKSSRPVAGYIFFAYDGKLKSIRTVELLVDGMPLTLR
jgi:hypothetical protein